MMNLNQLWLVEHLDSLEKKVNLKIYKILSFSKVESSNKFIRDFKILVLKTKILKSYFFFKSFQNLGSTLHLKFNWIKKIKTTRIYFREFRMLTLNLVKQLESTQLN
jgi:hypothetical protein